MKNSILLFCFILSIQIGTSQNNYISSVTTPDKSIEVVTDTNDVSVRIANTISAEELKAHLTVLASDEFEGRETGTPGNEMAANYIADHFKSLGLPAVGIENSYFQKVSFNRTGWNSNAISVNNTQYKHLRDYMSFATLNDHMPNVKTNEIIFLGFGIDDPKYSDYKGNNVRGKIIMINKGEPYNRDSLSYISGTKQPSVWADDIMRKLETAHKHGAKMVLVIENELKSFLDQNRRFLVSPSLELGDGQIGEKRFANHAFISPGMAEEIIGKKSKKIIRWRKRNKKKGKARDIKLKPDMIINMEKNIDLIQGDNVLGFIEGTDKKDEVVVVSAHYDHLGKRGPDVFNGADDNGSGTSTVLELAQAFKIAKDEGYGPRRSVLFLLVTGEEKGLLGSEYYAENPIYPIEKTVANVNVDMVGRTDEKYEDNPNYIYVIGSDRLSMDLHRINESVNQKYSQITLDYTYNDENDPNRYYFRSDHYNFAKKNVPAIFFFSGVHKDYHRPSDTVEKILFNKMENVGKHIFHTAWELANREERIRAGTWLAIAISIQPNR